MPINESNNQELASQLRSQFQVAEKHNQAFEPMRRTNLSMYLGGEGQWSVYDNSAKRIVATVPTRKDETRITVNLIRKNIEARVSFLTGVIPKFEVVPNGREESDVQKARIAEKALDVIWDKFKLIRVSKSILRLTQVVGDAWLEIYWDWNKGNFYRDLIETTEETGSPILNEDGSRKTDDKARPLSYSKVKGVVQDRREKEGDLGFRIRFSDTVFPEPTASSFSYNGRIDNDAKWVFLADLFPLSTIKKLAKNKRYKLPPTEDADEEPIVTTDELYSYTQKTIMELQGRDSKILDEYGKPYGKDTKGNQLFVKVYRYFELPSCDYPKGRYAVILPDNGWWFLRQDDELPPPYENGVGIIPLVQFYDLKIEGSIYSDTRTSDAVPIQKEYNVLRSVQLEKNKKLQPLIIVDRNSGINPDAIKRNEVGEFIFKDGMNSDNDIKVVQPPNYNYGEERQVLLAKSEMEDTIGVHEPQRYPPERRTKAEVETIQAYDQSQLQQYISGDTEPSYEDVAKIILLFVKQFYTEQRVFKMMGERNKLQVVAFKGEDIDYHDVRVQPMSSMPFSKYINQQKVLFLAGQGFFNDMPEITKTNVIKMLEMKDVTPIRAEEYDVENAQNENWDLLNGDLPEPIIHDNHIIHNKEHITFSKSSIVRKLPQREMYETLMRIEAHINLHQIKMIQEQIAQKEVLDKTNEIITASDQQRQLESPQLPPQQEQSQEQQEEQNV